MDNLGVRMYNARIGLGLSLEAVGQYVGVGKSTVRKWENGIIKNMRRDKIKKLSEILHVSPGYLMGWTNDPLDYGEAQQISEETLSEFELTVIKRLRRLTEEQQQAFLLILSGSDTQEL